MKRPAVQRRSDPDRRQRIIDAALDVIVRYGVAGATHRRIATEAGVPLGSMTYHFDGIDDLLRAAFSQVADGSSAEFVKRLSTAVDREGAISAVVDIIAGNIWSKPRVLLLSYELYAFAARTPSVRAIMQNWMDRSREALGRHFDPVTCRALDALVEGIGIHDSVDISPMTRDEIDRVVRRLAG